MYISLRLMIRMRIAMATYAKVSRNITELPSPNQAVSEKGIYMFSDTSANSTVKVTVPISWYLPSR